MAEVEGSHVENGENDSPEETAETTKKASILDQFAALQHVTLEKDRVNRTINVLKIVHDAEDDNELNYALNRLIKGLASSRTVPRKNFFVALTQLLRIIPGVEVSKIFEIVKKELSPIGSNSKSENADIYFGKILLCGSMIKSGLYAKVTAEEQSSIVDMLIQSGKERHYLGLATWSFVLEICNQINEKQFTALWNRIKSEFETSNTVDQTYFLLKAQEKFPKVINKFFEQKHGSVTLFTHTNIRDIMDNLLTTPWLVKPEHPIYLSLSNEIKTFGVENWFLVADDYMNKCHIAMHAAITIIIMDLLKNLKDHSVIPAMFTENFLRYTFDSYRREDVRDDEFLPLMQKLFKVLDVTLQSDKTSSQTRMQILLKFLQYPGDLYFDSLTKTKIIHMTTNGLNTEDVKELVKLYKEILLLKNDESKHRFTQKDRVFAASAMVRLLKHPNLSKDKEYKMKMIKFFLRLAFLQDEKFPTVNHNLAGALIPLFYSILDQKFGKLEDLREILLDLIEHLNKKICNDPDNLYNPLSEDELEAWKEMIDFSEKLKSSSKAESGKLTLVFHVLCLQMGFQIFRDLKLASSSLKDIINCYDEQKKTKKKKTQQNDITWIEVVVDLFLNLLSQESHLLRVVVNCVFPHLCPYLNQKTMKQILDALFSDDENPLSEDEGDSNSDDSDEDKSGSDEDDDDDEEDEQEEEVDDEDEDMEDVEDDKLQPLKDACSKALGMDSDTESINVDDISEEEGRKIDEMLAECFRNFKPKTQKELKQQEKKEYAKIATFRSRVLDLLIIYLDTEPNLSVCLSSIPHLVHATFWSIKNDNPNLTTRIQSVLNRLSKLKKVEYKGDLTTEEVIEVWNELYAKNADITSNLLKSAMEEIVNASIFVLRAAQHVQKEDFMFETVSSTLERLLSENDAFIVVFVTKIFDFAYENSAKLLKLLISASFSNEKWFKRCRIFKLVQNFYCNNRLVENQYQTNPKVMKESWKILSKNSLEALQSNEEDNSNSKAKFLEILCLLFVKIKTGPCSQHCQKFDWDQFGELVKASFYSRKMPKDTKYAFRQLCSALQIPIVLKRPVDDDVQEKPNKKLKTLPEVVVANGAVNGNKKNKNVAAVETETIENGTDSSKKKQKKIKTAESPVNDEVSTTNVKEAKNKVKKKRKNKNTAINDM